MTRSSLLVLLACLVLLIEKKSLRFMETKRIPGLGTHCGWIFLACLSHHHYCSWSGRGFSRSAENKSASRAGFAYCSGRSSVGAPGPRAVSECGRGISVPEVKKCTFRSFLLSAWVSTLSPLLVLEY